VGGSKKIQRKGRKGYAKVAKVKLARFARRTFPLRPLRNLRDLCVEIPPPAKKASAPAKDQAFSTIARAFLKEPLLFQQERGV
jgi:hypothetical protein